MAESKIADDVRHFIFDHIDSAEQLEILLLLHSDSAKEWNVAAIATDLRTNTRSVEKRLKILMQLGLAGEIGGNFRYVSKNAETDALIKRVEEAYRTYRSSVYELIFSPIKRARHFAAAFTVKKDGGESDD